MRTRSIRFAALLALILSAGLAPCMADAPGGAPCPMAGCERPAGAPIDMSCCCATSEASAETSPGVFAPRPDPAPGNVAADVVLAEEAAVDPIAWVASPSAPEPVPLFLLHSSLLN